MRIAIVYDVARWEEKALIEACRRRGAEPIPLRIEDKAFELGELKVEADAYLIRCVSLFKSIAAATIIEAAGGLAINCSSTLITCGDKLLTSAALRRHGIPTPRTMIAFSREAVHHAASKLGYPVVLKPLIGSWGRLVARADDPEELDELVEHREALPNPWNRIHYVQEYINKPGRDIRIFTVGDEVPVAIYRISENWKTNTALGGKAEPLKVPPELEDLALRAARAVGGGVLGIDVLEDPSRGYLVSEVNGVVEFKNTVRVTGYDLPGKIVEYAISQARR